MQNSTKTFISGTQVVGKRPIFNRQSAARTYKTRCGATDAWRVLSPHTGVL